MRISDWSSDVCSSDLNANVARVVGINVGREKIMVFTLMGVLAALAAVLLTLENKNFFNTQGQGFLLIALASRSEEHTSELQSLMRISYAVFCLKKNKNRNPHIKVIKVNQSSN